MSFLLRDLWRSLALGLICMAAGLSSSAMAAELDHQRLFHSGQEGYPRYRIPSLVVTNSGALLAICEGRVDGGGLEGNVDLVLKRSEDGGRTWSKLQKIADAGDDTLGNPCAVVDRSTGVIWLPHTRSPGEHSEVEITTRQSDISTRVFVTHSADDGRTWAKPVEITATTKQPDWTWYGTGPGVGIQLRSGRLYIPSYHAEGKRGEIKRSHAIYSDDHGKSWKLGGVAGLGNGESQALQRRDGTLYLSARTAGGGPFVRSIVTSRDQGNSWSKKHYDKTIYDPYCEASLLSISDDDPKSPPHWLYCSPAGPKRMDLTIRQSRDEGKTWQPSLLLRPGNGQYTSMAMVSKETLGCFYDLWEEGNYQLYFVRVPLAKVVEGGE